MRQKSRLGGTWATGFRRCGTVGRIWGSLLVLAGLSACISPDPDPEHLAEVELLGRRAGTPFDSQKLLSVDPRSPVPAAQGTLTLEDAMARALARNLNLVASAESLAIAQVQLAQMGLLQNPAFSFLLRWNKTDSPRIPDAEGAISLLINQFFTLPTRLDIAHAQRFQTGIDLAANAFNLAEQVEIKYRQLAHTIRSRKVAERDADYFDRALQAAVARARVGFVPQSDVNRARLDRDDALRQVKKLSATYLRMARELNWLLGVPGPVDWKLPDEAEVPPKEFPVLPTVERLESLGTKFRLDLLRADFDRKIADSGIILARWGFVPQTSLGFDRERQEITRSVKMGPSFGFTIPILDPGIVGMALAKAQARQIDKVYVALEGQILSDVRSAHATVELDRGDVEFFRDRIIPQWEENIKIAQRSFELGNTDLDSLLNTLHGYAAAQQGYEDSIEAYYEDFVAFQTTVGLLWRQMVEEEKKLDEGRKK
jgi:cobalt-zinc-cadmium efflux system outer membrane protein